MIAVFLTLSMFDIITTNIALDMGANEFNPIMNFLMTQSYVLFIATKMGLTTLVAIFMLYKKDFVLSLVPIIVMLAIITVNLYTIATQFEILHPGGLS